MFQTRRLSHLSSVTAMGIYTTPSCAATALAEAERICREYLKPTAWYKMYYRASMHPDLECWTAICFKDEADAVLFLIHASSQERGGA